MKITYCKPDPLLDPKNRSYYVIPKYNHSKVHKDFADYVSQKVDVVYVNGEAIEYGTMNYYVKDVVSNFPAQYEQLEVNEQMKEFAQYHTGFRPVMK